MTHPRIARPARSASEKAIARLNEDLGNLKVAREAYCQFPATKNKLPCDPLLGLDIQMTGGVVVVVVVADQGPQ